MASSEVIEDQLWNTKRILETVGISRAHLYVLLGEDKFPRPIAWSRNKNLFSRNEVLRWVNDIVLDESRRISIKRSGMHSLYNEDKE
jgi:predicted DNA-binding transcriptional regulator AlpA